MTLLRIPNEKAAARTNRDGLDFVWTTTPSNGKDDDDVYIYRRAAPRN